MASRGMLPPPPKRPPVEGVEALFARFHRYLVEERGLVASTATAYARRARRFLDSRGADGDIRQLSAANVPDAIRTESAGMAVATTQGFVSVVPRVPTVLPSGRPDGR